MKRFLVALSVIGLSAVGLAAYAQMPHRGGGDPVAVIQAVKDKLALNTSQQQQWDAAAAQTQAVRQAMRAAMDQLKAATQAELAKPEPDLAALAAQADALHDQNAGARKAARDAWLALYATFSAQQKAVVRDAISARLARMEQFRAHMQQRMGQ
ncbi:MAG TPA: periplasmic heavy metal sensor [Casimicrobiaceae bacterium]|jgi:thiamine biosynthesis lipoprotein ApbE